MDVNELHLHALALDNGDYSHAPTIRDALRAAAEEIAALRRENAVLRAWADSWAGIPAHIVRQQDSEGGISRANVQAEAVEVLAEADKAREG